MLQTNPLLGTALSQQKRKRGRPRKLSGSDAGEGETDGNFIGTGEEYDSSSMDIMDVKIASSGASNSGDDDQQLRIVSSRTDDCDTPMHEKSEQMDEYDDEEMDDDADELVEDDDLETGPGDEPRGGTTPSLDDSMEVTTNNANNAHTNRSGRQHQRQGANSALTKPSRASKRTRMAATSNLRNNENSNMSGKYEFWLYYCVDRVQLANCDTQNAQKSTISSRALTLHIRLILRTNTIGVCPSIVCFICVL
uniref:Uncharacterized protein n=1 Tax=Anopheles maculatus TaxID=74869 RepID=A0A182SW59_9DIPT